MAVGTAVEVVVAVEMAAEVTVGTAGEVKWQWNSIRSGRGGSGNSGASGTVAVRMAAEVVVETVVELL